MGTFCPCRTGPRKPRMWALVAQSLTCLSTRGRTGGSGRTGLAPLSSAAFHVVLSSSVGTALKRLIGFTPGPPRLGIVSLTAQSRIRMIGRGAPCGGGRRGGGPGGLSAAVNGSPRRTRPSSATALAIALLVYPTLLAGAATAQPLEARPGPWVAPAVVSDEAPEDAGLSFDAASVIERTVLALRVRLLVETWPVTSRPTGESQERVPTAASFAARLDTAFAAFGDEYRPGPGVVRRVAEFSLNPRLERSAGPPTPNELRDVLALLERHYPRTATPSPGLSPPAGSARPFGDLRYTVFAPVGSELAADPSAGGAGVSFQQALIEGTTAFLLDRARADLARAGLSEFQKSVRTSAIRDAFSKTVALGGFDGSDADAYRDPRLYLAALQSALADDFDGLPTYVASALRGRDVMGLEKHEWELAYRAVELVGDVQQGTHPLLALSTFSGRALDGADDGLRSRLLMLHALTTALYAGPSTAEGRSFAARRVLETLDGRRLFAVFLASELDDSGRLPPECGGTVVDCADAVEARIASLRQTLDEVVREVADLRQDFAQIRAANPGQAGIVYADYIAVVTRAVRQVVVATGTDQGDQALHVLAEIERVLAIREAVVRRDYPGAVAHAMPYLTLIASGAAGSEGAEAVSALNGAVGLLRDDLADANPDVRRDAVRTADQAFSAARPLADAASSRSEARARAFDEAVRTGCAGKTGRPCLALRSLTAAYRDANGAWRAVVAEIGKELGDPAEAGSFEESRKRVRNALDLVRSAYDAEASAARRGRSVAFRLAERAREEIRDVDLAEIQRHLQAYASEAQIGQMLAAAAALAASTSSDDVYQTLVVYSAPPGSFRDRRRRSASGHYGWRATRFAVSAYPGVAAGYERVAETDGGHGGLSIPVGLEVSVPVESSWFSSLGLFVSPVDLGTYADFRLGGLTVDGEASEDGEAAGGVAEGASIDEEPAVTVAQVFSPKAALTVGLSRNFPATFGIATSYVPALRGVGGGAARSAFRVSAFLAVDVPLWIFR